LYIVDFINLINSAWYNRGCINTKRQDLCRDNTSELGVYMKFTVINY